MRYVIVLRVPESHGDAVRDALASAGAGRRGDYAACSFTVKGIGRFRPLPGASPAIGEVGRTEEVVEERIETICDASILKSAIAAVRAVHPYEEPSIDVFELVDVDPV